MIITTTKNVEGRSITKYLGLVAGETIMPEKLAREIIHGVADAEGEDKARYKKQMTDIRLSAIGEMIAKAEGMKADAIVAINFDYSLLMDGMLMIFVSGTAVKLADILQ